MITYVKSKEQIQKIIKINQKNKNLNEVTFQSKEFSSKELFLSLNEALEISSLLPSNIKKYFAIDIMPFNKDIKRIKNLLGILLENNFYGVRTEDLSLLNIIEENHINLKIILDSTTGGNNINYYNFFHKFKSIERIVLSRELSVDKIFEYAEKSKVKLELQSYGLLQIFHTKRKLIEAMENQKGEKLSKLLYLKEPKRKDESFPLLETNDGTIMFHSHLINFYDYNEELIKFNIIQLIDLRHVENTENYEKILNHFCNIESHNLSNIEKLPFLQVAPQPPKGEESEGKSHLGDLESKEGVIKAGEVLDSIKGKEIILKSFIELKLDMEVVFYNNKNVELTYSIKYLSKFGEMVYIIPWRKGVTANSPFYIRNYE